MGSNQIKMREVVKALLDAMYTMGIDEKTVAIAAESTNCHVNSSEILKAIKNARSALSESPRNCDIGTPYEQANRMRQFCAKHERNGIINCGYCPIRNQYLRDCTLAWAQMPYETKEGGAE